MGFTFWLNFEFKSNRFVTQKNKNRKQKQKNAKQKKKSKQTNKKKPLKNGNSYFSCEQFLRQGRAFRKLLLLFESGIITLKTITKERCCFSFLAASVKIEVR